MARFVVCMGPQETIKKASWRWLSVARLMVGGEGFEPPTPAV